MGSSCKVVFQFEYKQNFIKQIKLLLKIVKSLIIIMIVCDIIKALTYNPCIIRISPRNEQYRVA